MRLESESKSKPWQMESSESESMIKAEAKLGLDAHRKSQAGSMMGLKAKCERKVEMKVGSCGCRKQEQSRTDGWLRIRIQEGGQTKPVIALMNVMVMIATLLTTMGGTVNDFVAICGLGMNH